ncbi:hypothetical protein RYX36_009011, partial [Vicia faba]
ILNFVLTTYACNYMLEFLREQGKVKDMALSVKGGIGKTIFTLRFEGLQENDFRRDEAYHEDVFGVDGCVGEEKRHGEYYEFVGRNEEYRFEAKYLHALKSSTAIVLYPGRHTITFDLRPHKPGSYVLEVLTGQIGQLRFRSHGVSKVGPTERGDIISDEKSVKPILKVTSILAL